MNGYAFTRLYFRPSLLVVIAFLGLPLFGVYKVFKLTELHVGYDVWYYPHRAESVLLIVPLLCGFLVGATIVEVYNGRFSWTLPGVRRDFSSATILCGAVASVASASLYHLAGGELPSAPALAVAMLWYGLMVHAQVGSGRGASKSRLGLVCVGIVGINTIAAFGMSHPILVSALALAAAATALYFVFREDNLRNLKDSPRRSLTSGMTMYSNPGHRRELAAHAKPSGRQWTNAFLGDAVGGWIKAFEYETTANYRLGPVPLGANLRPLFFAAGALAVPLVFSVWFTGANWLGALYEWLLLVDVETGEPQSTNAVWLVTSLCIAAWGFELAMPANRDRLADLRPKFLYPLSRLQQGQIAFWSCVRANARYVGLVFLLFYMATFLCSLALHKGPDLSMVPTVVFPLSLVLLVTPIAQAFGICYLPKLLAVRSVTLQKVIVTVPFIGLAVLISYASIQWTTLASQFSLAGQVVAVTLAAAAIQFALYRRLQRHFAEADLTY